VGGYLGGLEPPPTGSDRFEPVFSAPGQRRHASLAGRIVQALFEASDGRIWVGTQQGDLAIVDPGHGKGLLLDYARDIRQPGRRVQSGRGAGRTNVGRPLDRHRSA
jgi:hypothetical protein